MRKLLIYSIVLVAGLTSACSVYRVDIQQGNTLDPEQIAQIKTGMSKRQVQFLLGSPLLTDFFHPNRWDYVYSYKPGSQSERPAQNYHVTLFFEGDRLIKIDRYNTPSKPVSNKT